MLPRTLVSVHAHPDDEALLTGGTLAQAAARGHRVVLVVATDGEAGLASSDHGNGNGKQLRQTRIRELERSAAALGCARVERLRFPDSGWPVDANDDGVFSRLPVDVAAAPLIRILREEQADAVTVYDPAGGYGHPDHRQVHQVGVYAAAMARTPVVLEATLPREPLHRLAWLVSKAPGLLDGLDPQAFGRAYTPKSLITHRIDVRSELPAKRAAMRAHASQATSDSGRRTLELLLRLPEWLFALVAGHEWFVQRGAAGESDLSRKRWKTGIFDDPR